jgi:iron complex outermembrane receptor protein
MHKVIRIATLSTAYLTFAIPVNAEYSFMVAATDTLRPFKEVEMEEVVISAQRAPVAFSQTARIVQIIAKEELANAPVHDLQDLLKFASGIDIRQRGGNGVQADVSIRGSSFDQVLILLNGIPLNDPQTGHHNLNLPVSYDAIDRIEILEGPAARIYGPNAFSGAINIITSQTKSCTITGRFSYGQHGFFETSIASSFQTGRITNNLSSDYKLAGGALPNTDFKKGNLFYHGTISFPSGKLELQSGYTDKGFGANEFYTPAYPNQFERIKTTFTSVKASSTGLLHLSPALYWRRNQDRFELFRNNDGAPAWYKGHNYHLTDTYGSTLSGWVTSDLGKLAFGSDIRNENIWSTVLGREMGSPTNVPGESGVQYKYSDHRTNLSLFGEYSTHFGPLDLVAGLMANNNSSLGRKWQIFPGIDMGYRIVQPLKLYLSLNKTLRLPTFTDLYYKSATNIGNPELLPEEALSFEAGWKLNNKWLSSSFSYFFRNGENMIDWVRKPEETIWSAKNLTKIQTNGVEVSCKIDASELFGREVFVNSLNLSYCYLDQNKESGSYISKYLLDYLKHKMDIRLTHKLFGGISASWLISYQDRNGTFTLWKENKYGAEVEYAPIWLVDSRINWTHKQLTVILEANNLLDKRFYDYGNVEQPGIWAKLGVIVKLGY